MQEHDALTQQYDEDAAALRRSQLNFAEAQVLPSKVEDELTGKIVEDYLDHIVAPMVGVVSFETRQELRRDMRAHLAQLIAAHEELGSDHAEATLAALRQFGPPSVVSRKWLEELPQDLPDQLWADSAATSLVRTAKAATGVAVSYDVSDAGLPAHRAGISYRRNRGRNLVCRAGSDGLHGGVARRAEGKTRPESKTRRR